MTSWSQLIEKIHALCHAFEEDLASSCCQSLEPALVSDQATIAVPTQFECHAVDIGETSQPVAKQLKSSCQSTVSAGEEMSTSVQKKHPQLPQPVKPKSDYRWQKKCRYVNKKFIICKDTRKDESDFDIVVKRSGLKDPFEFVGTQNTPVSNGEKCEKRDSADQLMLFGELPQQQSVFDDRHTGPVQSRSRKHQRRPRENTLKQLADDIADAEMYSLVISQQHSAKLQPEQPQTSVANSDNAAELTQIYYDIVTNEPVVTDEVYVNDTRDETVAATEADLAADTGIVHVKLNVNADDGVKEADMSMSLRAGERQCVAGDAILSDLDVPRTLNVETIPITLNAETIPSTLNADTGHSGQLHLDIPVMLNAKNIPNTFNAETACVHSDVSTMLNAETIPTTLNDNIPTLSSVSHNAEVPETCQLCFSQQMVCDVEAAVAPVQCDNYFMSHAVNDTSSDVILPLPTVISHTVSDVSSDVQYNTCQRKAETVASMPLQNTLCRDSGIADGHVSLPLVYDDGSERMHVIRSHRRRRRAQQKKHENKNRCYDGSRLKKVKCKATVLIASDIEDDSSGLFFACER